MAHNSAIAESRVLKWISGLVCSAALALLPMPAMSGPICGPGSHWVDGCPSGLDVFPLTNGSHTIEIFGIGTFTLLTTGPTTIWRGAGMTSPDHHIDTELVALQLVGGGLTLIAGDGVANGISDGPLWSPGRITEQAGDSTQADSFFDIFFEIQGPPLGPLGPLHNEVPCRMEAVIDRVPPITGTTYICDLQQPVLLFDQTGQRVGQLLSTTHEIVVPEPTSFALLALGLAGLGFSRRRKQ